MKSSESLENDSSQNIYHISFYDLQKSDYKKAIQFAIKDMHFGWYLDNVTYKIECK